MYWRIKVLPQGFLGEFVGLGGKKALPVFLHKSLTSWGVPLAVERLTPLEGNESKGKNPESKIVLEKNVISISLYK